MDLGIAGRVAMVSGATSGLGKAAALALAAEGCVMSISGRDPGRLKQTAEELTVLSGQNVLAHELDIRVEEDVSGWVADTARQCGGPHIVVANGGSALPGPVDRMELEDYREALNALLLPHLGLALTALPYLRETGWGRILLVGSERARQPIVHYGLSSTARPALLGFARSLVASLAQTEITVNVLLPGYHDTAGLRRQFGAEADEKLAEIGSHIPVGRVGRAADFGAVVAFLASVHASFITGTSLLVDGGATKGTG
jgi:3-oxoacyl-[acyl-carrier protein] reductase